ncbi:MULTISPECIES: ABC transporter ATP-binding protein [unclassified Corynebacterium]|uniref:ABC transporter ATP-binding protein n=1 Tax=unclassified Corynebacterium TaxID=2624378 RepID=UPI0029C9C8BA|nr:MULTISPECIES: ABC transporter ATP-binding protein [unclassified Corynebacterium]WPF67142.1 ABC transporter ATP-binding protein [Corynebacterium sp. 22KM0430]WPF69630.1 ABC transporter ATP-binding protein [Corynebacterium sp. 21KM1197]
MFPVATWAQIRAVLRLRPRAVAALVFLFCGSAMSVAIPHLMGLMVDAVIGGQSLLRLVGLMVGAALCSALLSAVGFYLISTSAERGIAGLRATLVITALALPVHRVEEAGSGDLVSRSTDDVSELSSAVTETVPILSSSVFTIAATVVALVTVDAQFALVLLVAPLYYLGARRYLRVAPARYARERALRSDRARRVLEAVHGAETIRAYGMEEKIQEGIRESSLKVRDTGIAARTTMVVLQGWVTVCEFLTLALALLIGYTLDLSVGAVTGALLMLIRLRGPIMMFMRVLDTVQSAYASLARIVGVPQVEPQPDSGAGAPRGVAELRGVSFSYGTGWAVREMNLRIDPGQSVALVGASGAGKSTVAALLAGLRVPTRGEALIDAVAVSTLSDAERAGRVALISQEINVFGTPREDLALACPEATGEDMRAALRRVGAEFDLDTEEALEPVAAQQLALARILLMDPALVIMDEATAEAGSAHAGLLEKAAAEVLRGRSSLVVAHRLDHVALADRVLVMDNGEVIEAGSHEELLARGGRYAQLWQAWVRGRRG